MEISLDKVYRLTSVVIISDYTLEELENCIYTLHYKLNTDVWVNIENGKWSTIIAGVAYTLHLPIHVHHLKLEVFNATRGCLDLEIHGCISPGK